MSFHPRHHLTLGLLATSLVSSVSSGNVARAQISSAQQTPALPALKLTGAIANSETLTVETIKTRFASDLRGITFQSKDKVKHTGRAIPLLALVNDARPKINPNIKHHELQFVIVVRGHDGYAVDFSYAELLPEIGNRQIWVLVDEDGKPPVGEDGPVDLIAADDVKPARWVHAVAAISVVDGAALDVAP